MGSPNAHIDGSLRTVPLNLELLLNMRAARHGSMCSYEANLCASELLITMPVLLRALLLAVLLTIVRTTTVAPSALNLRITANITHTLPSTLYGYMCEVRTYGERHDGQPLAHQSRRS